MDIFEKMKNEHDRNIVFVDKFNNIQSYSYSTFYEKALDLVKSMKKIFVQNRKKIIIQCSDNEHLALSLWSCHIGKFVSVPLELARKTSSKEQLSKIVTGLEEPVIISDIDVSDMTEKTLIEKNIDYYAYSLEGFIIFEILNDNNDKEIIDDVDMLIFTSGSTSNPKAIPLTNKKISTIIESMNRRWNLKSDDKFLTWLPITHVTGLILMHLTPINFNLDQIVVDPELVISQPERWLDLIWENCVTHTCTTNTGMHSILNYYLENDNSIPAITKCRAIWTMGEPISEETCNKFGELIKEKGISRQLITPFYGMSEATLGISSGRIGDSLNCITIKHNENKIGNLIKYASKGLNLVSVGKPFDCCDIRITDNQKKILEEGYIGAVEIKGPNIMDFYYRNNELTKENFTSDGWFKTGDIGFIINGLLYISGRSKDIFIVNGVNYYTIDVEQRVNEIEWLRNCLVVALPMEKNFGGKTDINLAVEIKGKILDSEESTKQIKKKILKEMGVVLNNIMFLKEIPITPSNKIEKNVLKNMFSKLQI